MNILEEIDSPPKFDVIPNTRVDESMSQQNCMLFNYFKTRIKDLKNNKISETSKSLLSNIENEPSEVELKSTNLNHICQIIELKNSINYRKDNIIYSENNKDNSYKRKYCQNKYYVIKYLQIKDIIQNILKHESNAQINLDLRILPIW